MSQTADIKAMLDWLASCPLATTLNDGDVVFSIEYLGADTEQMQFSLEATPTAMVLEQFSAAAGRRTMFWHPAWSTRPGPSSRPRTARSGMNLPSG